MEARAPRFPDDHKYGLIALPTGLVDDSVPPGVELGGPFVATRRLPFPLPGHWTEWIGTFGAQQVENSRLFLCAVAPTRQVNVLDGENKQLLSLVNRLYFGLAVASQSFDHDEARSLTGGISAGEADVRQVGTYPAAIRVAGASRVAVGIGTLRMAYVIAMALGELLDEEDFSRTWRVTHAFRRAYNERELGERTHQFVRCVEGFILPDQGRTRDQFKQRCRLFVGRGWGELLGILFDIRSKVEHLHGPLTAVPFTTRRDRHEFLARYALVAEALARYCLHRVLVNKDLWQWFRTDEEVGRFWNQLSGDEREQLWGRRLDLRVVSRSFRVDVFDQVYEE